MIVLEKMSEFYFFLLMFLPVNGVALQDNDHRTDDSIFISVILLMAIWTMVCMVAYSRANQSSTLGQGDECEVSQGEDDDDDDQDSDNTELDNIYLLPQDKLQDHKIEIIAGSKIGSKWLSLIHI